MPSKKSLKSITRSARRAKNIKKCPPGKRLYLQCSRPCTNARNGSKRFRSLSGRCKSKPKGMYKYTDAEYANLFKNAIKRGPLNYVKPSQILRRSPRRK